MRTLGPGSVSSFLKVVLDVVYIVLWISTAALSVAAVAVLVALPFSSNARLQIENTVIDVSDAAARAPALAGLIVLMALYLAAILVVVNRLRRVFGTLTLGDPFQPENVGRLRVIGLALIAIQVIGHVLHMATGLALVGRGGDLGFTVNLSAWFSILVVFVLAEVFREGARLRREAELTI